MKLDSFQDSNNDFAHFFFMPSPEAIFHEITEVMTKQSALLYLADGQDDIQCSNHDSRYFKSFQGQNSHAILLSLGNNGGNDPWIACWMKMGSGKSVVSRQFDVEGGADCKLVQEVHLGNVGMGLYEGRDSNVPAHLQSQFIDEM